MFSLFSMRLKGICSVSSSHVLSQVLFKRWFLLDAFLMAPHHASRQKLFVIYKKNGKSWPDAILHCKTFCHQNACAVYHFSKIFTHVSSLAWKKIYFGQNKFFSQGDYFIPFFLQVSSSLHLDSAPHQSDSQQRPRLMGVRRMAFDLTQAPPQPNARGGNAEDQNNHVLKTQFCWVPYGQHSLAAS